MAFAAFVKHCAAPSGEIIYLPGGSFLLPMLVKTDDGHRCDLRDWYRIKYDHIGRQASVRLLRDIERVRRSESMMWAELRCCSRELRESFQPAMPTDTFRCWMSDVMRLSSFASQTLQNRLLERLVERPDYERELIDMIPDFVLRRAELELVKNVESELLTESSAEPRGSAIVYTNDNELVVISAAVPRDNNLVQSDWLVYCEVDTLA